MSEEETRQRLLNAAAQVFAERGYEGATTRAIAGIAKVNEVTLFRHFGSKKSLFEAMIARNSAMPGLEAAVHEQFSGDFHLDLIVLVTNILNLMLTRRQEILMSLAEAERLPEMREMIAHIPALQQKMISEYLERQMSSGKVRQIDPDLASQALLGMLLSYSISQNLLPESLKQIPINEVAAQFVDLFINGTAA